MLLFAAPVGAQSSESESEIGLPGELTREEVRDTVARLSDDQLPELVIRQYDKRFLPRMRLTTLDSISDI